MLITFPKYWEEDVLLRNRVDKDRKEVLDLIKLVYQISNQLEAQADLDYFINQIVHRYPKVVKFLNQNQSLFSFMVFPKSILRSLYTTNLL